MPIVGPSSTFTFNGPKTIEQASDENDYDGTIAKPHTDYVLRFTIQPTGVHNSNTNIIHITTGYDCCAYGTNVPAVFFVKKTTQLHIITGSKANEFYSTKELALNIGSDIEIRVVGTSSTLSINGVVDTSQTTGGRFPLTDVKVYLGDPWYAAVNAIISNVYFGSA